jgi:hypothetical protein
MYPPPTSSVLAQSANQVLSEVSSDPAAVLSAWPMCCPYPLRCTPGWLCGLLILLRLLGEFDGEQSLHAGAEVEDFTGPAGTNRSGIRVVEAVHRSQLITLPTLSVSAA